MYMIKPEYRSNWLAILDQVKHILLQSSEVVAYLS